MINSSSFGLAIQMVASVTFPSGFTITEFSDDQAPFDTQPIRLAESAMGTNGHHIVWQRPNVIPISISVIPETESDRNLTILGEANRMSKTKGRVPLDEITLKILYPNGKIITLTGGMISEAPPAVGSNAQGRLTTRTFQFLFEDRDETNPA